MKEFFSKKGKGYLFSLAAILSTAVGLIFFRMLTSVSVEQSERPALVIALAFGAILFDLIATYKDYAKVPSIAAYALTTALFFSLLEGRVSYLAFYFSGDVLDTGLSPYLVIAFILFLLAVVFTLLAVVCKQEKDEQYSFRVADLKVIIPMIAVVGILCGVAVSNSSGAAVDGPSVESGSPAESGEPAASEELTANYKTPTVDEDIWQGYSPKDYVAEDVSAKAIAYQLTGHADVDAGGPMPFDAILNLYEDGEAVLTTYGMNRATIYYGYWTNENDENLWFCDYNVPQRRKGSRHAACCGVGQNCYIKQSRVAVAGNCTACLSHLHKGNYSLLHSRASGGCEHYHRKLVFCGEFKGSGDLLAHNASHGSHHVPGIHYTQNTAFAPNGAFSRDNAVFKPGAVPQSLLFRVISGEIYGIQAKHIRVEFRKAFLVRNELDTFRRSESGMVIALGTNLQIFFQLVRHDNIQTAGAFKKHILRHLYRGIFFSRILLLRCAVETGFHYIKKIFKTHIGSLL